MQQKINLRTTKPFVIFTLLLCLLSFSLVGCTSTVQRNQQNKDSNVLQTETTLENSSLETLPETENTNIKSQKEVSEESTSKADVQESNISLQTMDEWIQSLQLTEGVIAIWNADTSTGKVLKDEEEYQMVKGDQLLVCSPEMIDTMWGMDKEYVMSSEYCENYVKYNFEFTGTCDFIANFNTVDSKSEYNLRCFLISAN